MKPSVAGLLRQALQLQQQGRWLDAERLYNAVLAEQPKNHEALKLLGVLKMQQGQIERAAELLSASVKCNPTSCEALTLLASILLNLNKGDEALSYLDRAVAAEPSNADTHYNRAVVLERVHRDEHAIKGYDHVVAAQPSHTDAWFNRGNVLARLARCEEAIVSFDRALALVPNNPNILCSRGNTLFLLGRYESALASFEQALSVTPDHVDALTNRATALKALNRNVEALASCEQALAIKPDHIVGLIARGNILHAMERYADALAAYDKALSIAPSDTKIIGNRITSLLKVGRLEEALVKSQRMVALDPESAVSYYRRACVLQALQQNAAAVNDYEKAITIRPDYADAHFNLGIAFQAHDCHVEAIAHFDKAIALHANFSGEIAVDDAKLNASFSYLCLGRFSQGWDLYEHRWSQNNAISPRNYSRPRWDGQHVPGVILAWAEQGLGDEILYASLLPDLQRYAEKVIIEVDHRLVNLFARSFPEIKVAAYDRGPYDGYIDAHVPFGSLPKHLRQGWEDFPALDSGYLVSDGDRTKDLRARLKTDRRPLIGLSWISRNANLGSFKSAQLKDFRPLLQSPAHRFVDLQYGDTTTEREAIEREIGVRIEHLDDIDNTNDIDGLAALISACDAVLTVSNTTAHLAGALGVPTWVMVPFGRGRFWYWFCDRPTNPWYARVQSRRQGNGQSWADLIAAVASENQLLG